MAAVKSKACIWEENAANHVFLLVDCPYQGFYLWNTHKKSYFMYQVLDLGKKDMVFSFRCPKRLVLSSCINLPWLTRTCPQVQIFTILMIWRDISNIGGGETPQQEVSYKMLQPIACPLLFFLFHPLFANFVFISSIVDSIDVTLTSKNWNSSGTISN